MVKACKNCGRSYSGGHRAYCSSRCRKQVINRNRRPRKQHALPSVGFDYEGNSVNLLTEGE